METATVCQSFIYDASFYQLLVRIDQDIAQQVQQAGCPCGGVLHSACYPRKPRGVRDALSAQDTVRFSFCCAVDGCRARATPPSVRFLGRRVYMGVIVVLLTALHHGLNPARTSRLIKQLNVPAQTLTRWRRWWQERFPQTRCWRAEQGQFIPPIDTSRLPDSLLVRLQGGDLAIKLCRLLLLVAPVTSDSSPYLPAGLDPQKM